jgi:hypothetical protein
MADSCGIGAVNRNDNRLVRPERFVSEPGEFVIVSGPRRGQVLGIPEGTPLSEGQKEMLSGHAEEDSREEAQKAPGE